jgi:hypothetical protein
VSTGRIPFEAQGLFADEELGDVVGNVVEFINAPRRDTLPECGRLLVSIFSFEIALNQVSNFQIVALSSLA